MTVIPLNRCVQKGHPPVGRARYQWVSATLIGLGAEIPDLRPRLTRDKESHPIILENPILSSPDGTNAILLVMWVELHAERGIACMKRGAGPEAPYLRSRSL